MAIRIFDSLTRKKTDLVPLEPDHVRMYVCGPTVYNFIHIGNARPVVAFDVVARHLRERGLKVTYVRNITDVDDKIIHRAAELGQSPAELAAQYADEFHADIAALGCVPPTVEPRVTTHIAEIISLIEKLVARGVAYASEGDVYFSVGDFAPYGDLSHQPLDALQAGARVDVGEKKRAPLDFALWKSAKPGEPSWDSPWGKGRPGWHIECSAMAKAHLGVDFDLHGGGVDLTFPHHENERAQSQGADGVGTFARIWMHNGFINFGAGKISKSDTSMKILFERAFKLRAVLAQHSGEAVRFFLLTSGYRSPIQYEVTFDGDPATAPLVFPGLDEAEQRTEYGYVTIERLQDALAQGKPQPPGPLAPECETWLARLQDALDDDFNTAEALAAHGEALALVNRILDGKLALAKDVKRRTLERLAQDLAIANRSLGLLEADPAVWLAARRTRRAADLNIDPVWVEGRIVARAQARAAKDFAASDAIRDELKAKRVEIMDTPRGTTWRIV